MAPSIIRVPQQYAVNTKNIYVQDALATIGEECIALSMFHIVNDEGKQPRCSNCYDDIYKSSAKFDCTECFGTTFIGGVKKAQRVFAVFNDSTNIENFGKRGENAWNTYQVQVEAAPTLRENDFLLRVVQWQSRIIDGNLKIRSPKVFGPIYRVDVVQEVTLRTGARFAQTQFDKIGQKAALQEVSDQHPIYSYVVPEPILRSDEMIVNNV